ncbi:hypothetical protein DYH09_04710 [bacterium CPR1]|nr:hypothetical protein [bacterium CPR1]
MRKLRSGSTLIELLVCMFLLSVAFLSLLGVLANGHKATALARDNTIATQLAREYLEQYRKNDYNALSSVPENEVKATGSYQGRDYATVFQRKLEVSPALDGEGKSLKAVVRWQTGSMWHAVEMRTLVAAP